MREAGEPPGRLDGVYGNGEAAQTELYIEDCLHTNDRGYRRRIEPIRSALSAEISPGRRSN